MLLQSDSDIHTHTHTHIYILSFTFSSIMGYYKIPSTAPCTIQQVLIGYLLHIQRGLPGSAVSKTLPADAGNSRDTG